MNLAEQVRQAGVVGAGGGGFPTHVKLNARAETVIANGAVCANSQNPPTIPVAFCRPMGE